MTRPRAIPAEREPSRKCDGNPGTWCRDLSFGSLDVREWLDPGDKHRDDNVESKNGCLGPDELERG